MIGLSFLVLFFFLLLLLLFLSFPLFVVVDAKISASFFFFYFFLSYNSLELFFSGNCVRMCVLCCCKLELTERQGNKEKKKKQIYN